MNNKNGLNNQFETFSDLLDWRVQNNPDKKAFTFLNKGESTQDTLTYKELEVKAKKIAYYLQNSNLSGEPVLLIYQPGLQFIISFIGCLYAGVYPIPSFPPELHRLNQSINRIKKILIESKSKAILSTSNIIDLAFGILSNEENKLSEINIIATDKLEVKENYIQLLKSTNKENIAFIQYTSGSTSSPKGVIISHTNILSNLEMIKTAFELTEENFKIGGWLPFYHDMGLMGHILQPLYIGGESILMSPVSFLQSPFRWLNLISKYKVNSSSAPNFAYDLCLRKISEDQKKLLDLSSWENALNGSEPVNYDTISKFYEYFKECGLRKNSLAPSYGMAEATVFISSSKKENRPFSISVDKKDYEKNIITLNSKTDESIKLVSSGKSWLDEKILIVNSETLKECNNNEIGEIWVSGNNISSGYWNNKNGTENTFNFYTSDSKEKSFLRTGDLGFIHNNELFVTGRLKDLIIIRGRNIYPQDIERVIEDKKNNYSEIKDSGVIAISVNENNEEKVIVFIELSKNREINFDDLIKDIITSITQCFDIRINKLVFLENGSLPKTSSGKVMRNKCKQIYIDNFSDNSIKVIKIWEIENNYSKNTENKKTSDNLTEWIINWLSTELNINKEIIETNKPFSYYGMDSSTSLLFVKELEDKTQKTFYETVLWDYKTIDELTEFINGNKKQESNKIQIYSENVTDEDIAVIGFSCRFPGNINSPDDFWEFLLNKRDGISDIPLDRWSEKDYFIKVNSKEEYHKNYSNLEKTYVNKGGFINDIDKFEPEFFGISPREAEKIDPQQRILLELTWEALENSGILPDNLKETNTGVFIGISNNDYSRLNQNLLKNDPYWGIGNAFSVSSGRISYIFGFNGPNMIVDTACSSSLSTIHLASQSLKNNECDIALAGGVNLIITPDTTIYFSKLNALSIDGHCKTFDESADGYVRSEGCGIVVLKKLSKAILDNDNILCIIKSSSVNHNGTSNGLTAPNGKAQIQLINNSLQKAKINNNEIKYLESFGTGTALGDPIELHSIINSLGKNRDDNLFIGAVKSNIGHLESSAGIAGFIKTALISKNKKIPPNIHFNNLNPKIKLNENDKIEFPTEIIDLENYDKTLYTSVSSFGISGTNVNIILQEYPNINISESDYYNTNILTISAKNNESLRNLIHGYYNFNFIDKNLYDICYTASTKRTHFQFRKAFIFNSEKSLLVKLKDYLENPFTNASKKNKKILYVFSGQGSHWIGMCKTLFEQYDVFKNVILECEKEIKKYRDFSISEILLKNEDINYLEYSSIIQPLLFSVQIAISKLLEFLGIIPNAVLGHSMGEVSAAYISGVLNLEDAVKIICFRSKYMSLMDGKGAMLFVELEKSELLKIISEFKNVSIGVENSKRSNVLTGDKSNIEELEKIFNEKEIYCKRVKINIASHSYQMKDIINDFKNEINGITLNDERIDIFSSVKSGKVHGKQLDENYWVQNILNPVLFYDTLKNININNYDLIVEISPNTLLKYEIENTLKELNNQTNVLSPVLKNKDENKTLFNCIGTFYENGININWKNIYKDGNLTYIPNYKWNKKRYWIENIEQINPVNNLIIKKQSEIEESKPPTILDNNELVNFIEFKEKEKSENIQDWLYQVNWEKQNILKNNTFFENTKNWLIFSDNEGFGNNLGMLFEARRKNCIYIKKGKGFEKVNSNNYVINPENIFEINKIIELIGIEKESFGIIYLWSSDNFINNTNLKEIKDYLKTNISIILELVKYIGNQIKNNYRMFILTKDLINNENIIFQNSFEASPLLGFSKVINYEYSNIFSKIIDLQEYNNTLTLQTLFNEIINDNFEFETIIKNGERFVSRFNKFSSKELKVINNKKKKKSFLNNLKNILKHENNKQLNKALYKPENKIKNTSTYLITGGLGGLGLLCADWLINKGAKNIVLTGRKGVTNKNRDIIDILKKKANIVVKNADISNPKDLEKVFNYINENLPEIKGIIHSAGIIDDSVINNLSFENFENSYSSKIYGTLNLHNLTKNYNLDFFILFSSLSSVIGSPGQANYSSANSFLDYFSYYRMSKGLHSLSINWSTWAEVGLANIENKYSKLEDMGVYSIDPNFGIKIFDEIFEKYFYSGQICISNINILKMYKFFPIITELNFFDEIFKIEEIEKSQLILNSLKERQKISNEINNKDTKKDLLLDKKQVNTSKNTFTSYSNLDDILEEIQKVIIKEISTILNLEVESIDSDLNLREYGFDSIMAIELRNTIENKLNITFSPLILQEYSSIKKLSNYLAKQIFEENSK